MTSQEIVLDGGAELVDTDDGPTVAEILSTIVIKEATLLKHEMLRKQGNPPMKYGALTYGIRSLETSIFGSMQIGEFTHGWTAGLYGDMPEAVMWSGKQPDDESFIDFSQGFLSLYETTTDSTGNTVARSIRAHIDTDKQQIYDCGLNAGLPVVDEDFGAELRVILEYGLEALFPKHRLRKILAAI